mgnify:CR=1 FL=1
MCGKTANLQYIYNKTNPDGICGRSITLQNYDSRTDASADQRDSVPAMLQRSPSKLAGAFGRVSASV